MEKSVTVEETLPQPNYASHPRPTTPPTNLTPSVVVVDPRDQSNMSIVPTNDTALNLPPIPSDMPPPNSEEPEIDSLLMAQRARTPVAIVVSEDYSLLPFNSPYPLVTLGWFWVVDAWVSSINFCRCPSDYYDSSSLYPLKIISKLQQRTVISQRKGRILRRRYGGSSGSNGVHHNQNLASHGGFTQVSQVLHRRRRHRSFRRMVLKRLGKLLDQVHLGRPRLEQPSGMLLTNLLEKTRPSVSNAQQYLGLSTTLKVFA